MVVINLKLFSIFTEINFLKEITLLSPRIMISLPRMMSNFDIIRKKNTSHISWVSKKLPILFKNLSSRKCTRSLNLEGKKEKGQEKEMQNWNTKEKTTTTKTWKKNWSQKLWQQKSCSAEPTGILTWKITNKLIQTTVLR